MMSRSWARYGPAHWVMFRKAPTQRICYVRSQPSPPAKRSFGPGLARRALHALSTPQEPAFAELTRREREVLELIASGMSNQAIAAKLGLSANTISNHISSIFGKLQVSSRAEAIVRARSAGLGE